MSCKFVGVYSGREREREKGKRWYCIDFTSMAMFNKDRIDFSRNQLHVFPMKLDRFFLPFSLSLSLARALFFLICATFLTRRTFAKKKRRKKIAHNVLIYIYEWVKFFESTCQLEQQTFLRIFRGSRSRVTRVLHAVFQSRRKIQKSFQSEKDLQFFHRNSSKWRDKQRDARESK